jgi:Arc/MetJ-type ribon-helix-helix transcriptional regulator
MDVSLTPELERRIAEKVDAGLYATPGEAVREARMARMDAEIDVGLIELEQGRGLPGEPVFAALKAKIAKLRAR